MGIIKKTFGYLSALFIATLIVAPAVFAGNEGGAAGGGGEWVSCGSGTFLSTECGAEWRYYRWGESADGVSYSGDTITVDQFYLYDEAQPYAKGGTLTGCKSTGGYWRYGMVAVDSYYGYTKGSQVGLIGLNGGGDWYFLSEEFGGGMNNLNSSSWNQARKVYESYQQQDPNTYYRGWSGGSDLAWFCGGFDPIEKKTLTGVAVDINGNNMSGISNVSSTVQKGKKAQITRQNVPTGYTYRGWRTSKTGAISVTNTTYTVDTLNSDTTVYSVYEKNTFSGRATSKNHENTKESSTGWTNQNAEADTVYVRCPAEDGTCQGKISFDIQRTGGTGETTYTIANNSGNPISGHSNAKTSDGKMSAEFDVPLKVGDKVCYSMTVLGSLADNHYFTVKACLAVPYNFTTGTEPNVGEDEVIYSGEDEKITYTVTVNDKDNDVTGGRYCTSAPNSDHGIQVKYGNEDWKDAFVYSVKNGRKQTLNCGDSERNEIITVEDRPAGTPICIRTFITPSNSGSNTNLDINGFNYDRTISGATKCYIVAKRPNMQVLGGSYYSGKKTNTSTALKHIDGGVKVFGSFAEQSVIGVGTIQGFASGSANSLNLQSTEFCKYRTLLTFNNSPCSGDSTRKGIGAATANDNRDSLVDYWVAGSIKQGIKTEMGVVEDGTYDVVNTLAGKPVRYTNTQADLTIAGGIIPLGVSRIIKTTRNVTINGNITYASGNYSDASQIPKLIISANQITIDCDVTNIDAILISKTSVNTCNNHDSAGNADNSEQNNQLVIHGMVIAGRLIPSRTYGAGVSASSNIPAEIINYDSSTMLWSQYMAGSADTGALTVTYQRELAPRY